MVVLTTINSEFLNAAKNFLNPDTLIVVNSDFAEELPNDLGLDPKNIFSYNSQFEIDIPKVTTMKLIYNENLFSDQTVIYIPKFNGIFIVDSNYGLFPFVIEAGVLQNFFND